MSATHEEWVVIPVLGDPKPRARARHSLMPVAKFDALIGKFLGLCAQGPASAFRAVLKSPGKWFRVNVHPDDSPASKTWGKALRSSGRASIAKLHAAGICDAGGVAIKDAHIVVEIEYLLPRPKGHYGTGKNAEQLKPQFEQAPTTDRADLDNYDKAVLDEMVKESIIPDDSRVQWLNSRKRYANRTTGAIVRIRLWQPADTYPQ